MKARPSMTLACIILLWAGSIARTAAQADSATHLTPWLDIPAAWQRTVQKGVVAVSPNDLAPGAQLILMVEPPKASRESLAQAYEDG